MDDKTLIKVRNRNNGFTGYEIPDMHIWRNFAPKESKQIPLGELRQLQYQPGGEYVLKNLFIVEGKEALDALNMVIEPEYNYTEDDIKKLLLEGTIDQLKDFLDFAPAGCIEIAKEIAVKEEIPDVRKRNIITEATGFNINNAINVNHAMATEDDASKQEVKKERRVAASNAEEPAQKQRRTQPIDTTPAPAIPNYKVVTKK